MFVCSFELRILSNKSPMINVMKINQELLFILSPSFLSNYKIVLRYLFQIHQSSITSFPFLSFINITTIQSIMPLVLKIIKKNHKRLQHIPLTVFVRFHDSTTRKWENSTGLTKESCLNWAADSGGSGDPPEANLKTKPR